MYDLSTIIVCTYEQRGLVGHVLLNATVYSSRYTLRFV